MTKKSSTDSKCKEQEVWGFLRNYDFILLQLIW